jgi:glycosyltransferase involved in cell wall biosynthesis
VRVVFALTFGERLGGAENMMMSFLRHADRTRIDPVVVFFRPGSWVDEVAALGIETAVIPMGRFRQPHRTAVGVLKVARMLRRWRPALLVNWFTAAQVQGAPAAVLAGMADRVVWWQHGVVGDDLWLDRLATLLPARAIGTAAPGTAAAQARMRPRRPTFVVLPGVERPDTVPAAEVADLRASLGVGQGTTVVGTVGRQQRWKAQHRLLDAIATARADGHDVHGLMVGGDAHGLDPGYAAWLRRRAVDLGIDEHVTFVGLQRQVGRFMQAMDVYVNTAPTEPFGIALVEAMALARPVVAVEAPGPRVIIEPGTSGLLASGDDPHALATAIGRLTADGELRERLARGGSERYLDRFTPERMSDELCTRLEELAR